MYQIGRFTVLGEHEKGEGIRILPHTHGNAYPWWSESTRNVLEALTPEDVAGKLVVDYGCGASAILGLAAYELGATLVGFVERDEELRAIAQRQVEVNGHPWLMEQFGDAEFILANLGSAEDVGKVSVRAPHGLGTDRDGQVIRW